jgi:Uncharacterised nucleotidyltransferase
MTNNGISAQFPLIAACCRWPPSEQRAATVRTTARKISDWDRFLRVVKRHRVAVLVLEALRAAAIEVSPAVVDELDKVVRHHVRHGLKLAAETFRLQSLIADAGIPNLVLKGVALEQLAYASIATKQTRDIDLLVPPECAEAALRIIEFAGYGLSLPAKELTEMQRRALIRFGREVELVDPRTQVRVDLQWRAADNSLLLRGVDAHSPTQDVALSEEMAVRTLAPDDLFAYLCVHGAHLAGRG